MSEQQTTETQPNQPTQPEGGQPVEQSTEQKPEPQTVPGLDGGDNVDRGLIDSLTEPGAAKPPNMSNREFEDLKGAVREAFSQQDPRAQRAALEKAFKISGFDKADQVLGAFDQQVQVPEETPAVEQENDQVQELRRQVEALTNQAQEFQSESREQRIERARAQFEGMTQDGIGKSQRLSAIMGRLEEGKQGELQKSILTSVRERAYANLERAVNRSERQRLEPSMVGPAVEEALKWAEQFVPAIAATVPGHSGVPSVDPEIERLLNSNDLKPPTAEEMGTTEGIEKARAYQQASAKKRLLQALQKQNNRRPGSVA